ncbi:GTPase HflX [Chlamydiifrater volucris]|uniref:GTPase HflX n=1 Tax=Chlamydiifrater volucris TaxID=2681470 RepID=UPI0032B2EF82
MSEEAFSERLVDFSGVTLPRPEQDPSQALLISCYEDRKEEKLAKDHVLELAELARSCGITTIETRTFHLRMLAPSSYLSEGKAKEVEEVLRLFPSIGVIIFDDEITASQQRNLEKRFGTLVMDRTEVILDIFSQRAITAEAGIQVELAKAKYLLPRLKRMWGHLSRQKSGGGGGYVKGEGEKQIELDKRMIKEKIHRLSSRLKESIKHREMQRKAKERSGIPSFALIGYTNAGKSSLFNALTDAGTYAEDKLFATLDPKTKRCLLPNKLPVLITDTVGFVRKLPHTLVAAFRSTLESALRDRFLIHVVDVSHPSAEEHIATTTALLKELKITDPKIITVLNKTDLCTDNKMLSKLRLFCPLPILVSCVNGTGISSLLQTMEDLVVADYKETALVIPCKEYHRVAELLEAGLVISKRFDEDNVRLRAFLPPSLEKKFLQYTPSSHSD